MGEGIQTILQKIAGVDNTCGKRFSMSHGNLPKGYVTLCTTRKTSIICRKQNTDPSWFMRVFHLLEMIYLFAGNILFLTKVVIGELQNTDCTC